MLLIIILIIADILMNLSKYNEALESCDAGIKIKPSNFFTYDIKGSWYFND